jgi:hypothetical protein
VKRLSVLLQLFITVRGNLDIYYVFVGECGASIVALLPVYEAAEIYLEQNTLAFKAPALLQRSYCL